MDQTAKYRRLPTSHPTPLDAVRLRILRQADETLAEVEWPENPLTVAGNYVYPTNVPLALERALDVRENYRFKEVVIILDDPESWNEDWGILVDF
jgi:hypothetical protein